MGSRHDSDTGGHYIGETLQEKMDSPNQQESNIQCGSVHTEEAQRPYY